MIFNMRIILMSKIFLIYLLIHTTPMHLNSRYDLIKIIFLTYSSILNLNKD